MIETKGERTRLRIVAEAAKVFSTRGYFGTSLSDLTAATGLERGAIYHHFAGKDELALAAFDYAFDLYRRRFTSTLLGRGTSIERLLALLEVFRRFAHDPVLPGGCPILNTGVEADDAHPALRDRAEAALVEFQLLIVGCVKAGIAAGEIARHVDPQTVATVITASVEGATLLTKLQRDARRMHTVMDQLGQYVRSLATTPAPAPSPATADTPSAQPPA